jgi:replicative DNA helicase
VLVGARPSQGKTLLAIGLAVEAMAQGRHAAFFTLELTAADFDRCVARLRRDIRPFGDRLLFDASDDISADHVVSCLASTPPGTVVVIDYLQSLGHRRGSARLAEQVQTLKRLAVERQAVVVCLSQIDRHYDAAGKPYPGLDDVRLPDPIDLSMFDQACLLGPGGMQVLGADGGAM